MSSIVKYYIISFLFFIISHYSGISQVKSPEFQFTLYAHDSLGHRDSVILGYDPTANDIAFDSTFGSVSLANKTFDSTFEIRAYRAGQTSTKKLIVPLLGDCNPSSRSCQALSLAYSLKYPPITFSWNIKDFTTLKSNNTCGAQSYLIYFYPSIQVPVQFDPDVIFLDENDSITISRGGHSSNISGALFDGINHRLYGYDFQFQQFTKLVATEDVITSRSISGYPNPAIDLFNVNLPFEESAQGENVRLQDAAGRQIEAIYKRFGRQIILETGGLAMGMYLLEIVTKEKHRYVSKFLKM